MKGYRVPFLWLSILAIGLVVASCAPAAQPTATAVPRPTATRAPAATSTPAATPTPAAVMAEKQVFTANLAGEPATLDPNRGSWAGEITVVGQLFDGLLGFNQDLSLKPVAAEAIPSAANGGISSDGKTYTFKLRKDVKWSDGKPVTAKDYDYSIRRMLDPALAAEYASFYYDIKGAQAYNTSKSTSAADLKALKDAVGVKAVDDYTLQVSLENPVFSMLQRMALWPVYPVRQDVVEKYGDKWTEAGNLVGNGAFVLKNWAHQDHITLEANPNYWGTKPKLQTIVLKMVTDINAELAAYKNNELDLSRVPPGTEKATMADPVLSKDLVRFNELTTFALQFNVTKPPLDNKLVRQALSMAVDREAYIDKVRNGVGKPAYSWIPPGMPGYDPEAGLQYKLNPTKAKELLTQAGYPDPSKLNLSFQFSDTAGNRVLAQFLQGQLKDNLGVNLTLEPMESKAFTTMVNDEKHTWALFGWGADWPDADNWIPEIFGTGGGVNHTLYSNPAVDAKIKQALAEPDSAKRVALWKEIQRTIVDDAPVVFTFYRERFILKKPWVKDLKTTSQDHQVTGDYFWYQTWIEKH